MQTVLQFTGENYFLKILDMTTADQGDTAGMLFRECSDIMDNTGHED